MTGLRQKILANYKGVKNGRQVFDSYYEDLRNYFDITADNIVSKKTPGSQLNVLFDAPGIRAANVIAAGLSRYLTPETERWCKLEHPNPRLNEIKEVKKFFQETTDELFYRLSKSNFYNQRHINHRGSPVYGTSGFMREFDILDGMRFYNIPIGSLYLVDDAQERPHEFYFKFEYSAVQAFEKFGAIVSDEIKKEYATGRNDEKKYEFVYFVGKNLDREPGKIDKKNKPIKGVWVEVKTGNIMLETGYDRMPCTAHRFDKRSGVAYGYSPAMIALPTARLTNKQKETGLRADMMDTMPARAFPDDCFIGRPNMNPNTINYYRRGKMNPREDIFEFKSGGNQQVLLNNIAMNKENINEFMFADVFRALSDISKQMTVPEVQQRIEEAMTVLGPSVSRYYSEDLQPTVEGVVEALFENGNLPQIPDVMLQEPAFNVKFVGRLMTAQKQGEINAMLGALSAAGQVAQYKPEVLDKINGDKMLDKIWDITGVDVDTMNDSAEVQQIRMARVQVQQTQGEMGMIQQGLNMYEQARKADAVGSDA